STAAAGDSTSAAGSPGGGGPGGAQVSQFQQKFPGTGALVRGVMGLRSLIQSNKTPLTALQAGHLYTVLLPLGNLPTLPQDAAKKMAQDLDGNLTPDQQEAIGAIRKQRRAGRGKGGAGGGYPGGAGGSNGSAQGAGTGATAGAPGAGGSPGAGGAAGGPRAPRFDPNMAPDTNVFKSGQPQKALTEVLQSLKTLQAG
ncbi:MAG: hypothetical protein M3Y56_01755, partial [Armatimonadota bacterium]|nr:hypothetical protein [Armatimonadota bacterium]